MAAAARWGASGGAEVGTKGREDAGEFDDKFENTSWRKDGAAKGVRRDVVGDRA